MNKFVKRSYLKSIAHLKRAETTIPLGSQTFSKSRTQYPVGISPLYIDRAKGCNVWDVDGNKYIDLVSSLASITLGYGDRDVNNAVKKQFKKGVSFSLPGVLEAEVSELLVDMVPSAEMVRFGKNGSDATAAAIRLARAFTGRDHIIVCGYHGWQDWYIGTTTRNKGVPETVSALSHKFVYNDIESLKTVLFSLEGNIAAVIMEPMNVEYPHLGFLEEVKHQTHNAGALLIFDETITGFRFSRGGAQELFGVTPDLSTFGKGLANGFPLSAIVGRRDVMMEMEQIFFSGTFGGELLSLAAAKVVLIKHKTQDICKEISEIGSNISNRIDVILKDLELESVLSLSGHPSWRFLNWRATDEFSVNQLKTYFMQEMFQQGILILGTHNITLAHNLKAQETIVNSYENTLRDLKESMDQKSLKEDLLVNPLPPLFKVR